MYVIKVIYIQVESNQMKSARVLSTSSEKVRKYIDCQCIFSADHLQMDKDTPLEHFETLWSTLEHSGALWSTLEHSGAQWRNKKHSGARFAMSNKVIVHA